MTFSIKGRTEDVLYILLVLIKFSPSISHFKLILAINIIDILNLEHYTRLAFLESLLIQLKYRILGISYEQS